MFLYLQNEITYSIKFGFVLKPVMSSKTSEKEILHKILRKVKLQKWNLKINSGLKGETSKMEPEN